MGGILEGSELLLCGCLTPQCSAESVLRKRRRLKGQGLPQTAQEGRPQQEDCTGPVFWCPSTAEELPGVTGAELQYGRADNWVTLLPKVRKRQALPLPRPDGSTQARLSWSSWPLLTQPLTLLSNGPEQQPALLCGSLPLLERPSIFPEDTICVWQKLACKKKVFAECFPGWF